MKRTYFEPQSHTFEVHTEGNFCQTGGKEGDYGDPGPRLEDDDIFDGGEM
jgi:hypothetical protein